MLKPHSFDRNTQIVGLGVREPFKPFNSGYWFGHRSF
jgi:hypothetical protein